MKNRSSLLSLFGLAALLAAGCSTPAPSSSTPSTYTAPVGRGAASAATNITVNFYDPDRFTDARSSFGGDADRGYLDSLAEHLRETASSRVKADQKLEVTFTDIDLAGDFRPDRVQLDDVRIIKDIYRPRMTLKFKLTGADGKVIKEGDRTLVDSYFMNNLGLVDRNEPLFYDKAMLETWVRDEFRS